MKALNQTWCKMASGKMKLVSEEEVEVPEPEFTLEERVDICQAELFELWGKIAELSGRLERQP